MAAVGMHFPVHKKVLKNGLTILTRPVTHIPRVESHLWYQVGSKDEAHNERGMAHLIEHMIFKGTKRLSETDINVIGQKLSADANAFTSQDYTCYTFRLPSHVWEHSLDIFADCMQNARFDGDMLASELKAVIEELRMYRDDFQGALLEQMIAGVFPEHPYRNPIIGSKYDLCDLTRDTLYAFYKKHYHPGNATLVVVGDVQPEAVFEAAEKYFGNIPAAVGYQRPTFHFHDDIVSRTTTLYRPVSQQWYSFLFKVPGFSEGKNHLLDLASIILSTGKSSRLYNRLVNKDELAVDVDCTVYDFFERGILYIGVWPMNGVSVEQIEEAITEEITALINKPVKQWEFDSAQKRTHVDLTSLLESTEKQAFVIGNSYIATQDERFVDSYLQAIRTTTITDIQAFFEEFFSITTMHKGFLLPVDGTDAMRLALQHQASDDLEQQILQAHVRKTPVEEPKVALTISAPQPPKAHFPQPKSFKLDNGLEVIYHHNPLVPQIVSVLNIKANYQYEEKDDAGVFNMLMRTITDCTTQYSSEEFAQMLETKGIQLVAGADNIATRCLTADFAETLGIVAGILKKPTLKSASIERIRHQMLSELEELWDSPIDYIDQLAKELVYKSHPYYKNPSGDKESISSLTKTTLQQYAQQYLSPHEAILVMSGDFSNIKVEQLVTATFEDWKGPKVRDIIFPEIDPYIPQLVDIPQQREQAVLAFVAPSIARSHPDYNALSLVDIVLTGGAVASPASRLFQLREESGLFYMIGGSLTYGSHKDIGLRFIKTIVAPEKALHAQNLILDTVELVGKNGITADEFEMAKNLHFAASVELFETNAQIVQTFLFLKKLNLSFNLFDKQGEILSILKLDKVNEIARKYCDKALMSVISIGRKKSERVSVQKENPLKRRPHNGKEKSS